VLVLMPNCWPATSSVASRPAPQLISVMMIRDELATQFVGARILGSCHPPREIGFLKRSRRCHPLLHPCISIVFPAELLEPPSLSIQDPGNGNAAPSVLLCSTLRHLCHVGRGSMGRHILTVGVQVIDLAQLFQIPLQIRSSFLRSAGSRRPKLFRLCGWI
jgi:hypothetical protein